MGNASMATVSVPNNLTTVQKRLPIPPISLKREMPEWYDYQLKFIRDIELNFNNVNNIKNTLVRVIETISVV